MAERSLSVPPKAPNPVRTPERNTTSLVEPWVFMGNAPQQPSQTAEYGRQGRAAVVKRPAPPPLRLSWAAPFLRYPAFSLPQRGRRAPPVRVLSPRPPGH